MSFRPIVSSIGRLAQASAAKSTAAARCAAAEIANVARCMAKTSQCSSPWQTDCPAWIPMAESAAEPDETAEPIDVIRTGSVSFSSSGRASWGLATNGNVVGETRRSA